MSSWAGAAGCGGGARLLLRGLLLVVRLRLCRLLVLGCLLLLLSRPFIGLPP